jgi:iron complex outermembrane receptor protein
MTICRLVCCGLLAAAPTLAAQQVTDSTGQRADSLARHPALLKAITVTAAPPERRDPIGFTSVSPQALRASVAINAYDLLRQTAGLEVHDQGQGPGFASTASLRGFASDHSTDIALWIDGVPVNEPVNGHAEGYNDWSLLFPAVVREIDVYKGPTSPLYGNFSLAGTVNVRTLERVSGTSALVSAGEYGRVDGTVLTGYDHGSNGGVFAFRGVREDGWRPNSAYRTAQGHARVVQDLSPSAALDLGVELYAAGWDSPGFLTDSQFTAGDYTAVVDRTDGGFKRRAQERGSLRILWGDSRLWRTTLYATQGRWQLFLNIPPEPGSGEGTGSQTEEEDLRYGFGLTSALTWALRSAEITLGGEARWDHTEYQNWLTTARVRDTAQDLLTARQGGGALFAQTAVALGTRLRLNLSGRYDAFDTYSAPTGQPERRGTSQVFSPKFGALYRLSPAGQLYANVSRGFRQPDGVVNDPALAIITASAYETGVRVQTRGIEGSLALFRMDVSNEQTFDPLTLETTSGGRSRRQGVELGLRAQLAPAWSLSADATLNDAKYRRLVTEDGDTLSGARIFNTARYVGSAALDLAPPQRPWRFRVATNVVGPYTPFEGNGVELPAYALLHLGGMMTFGRVEAQVGVRNVFNRAYPELRAGDFVAPGQPRSVYAGIVYR